MTVQIVDTAVTASAFSAETLVRTAPTKRGEAAQWIRMGKTNWKIIKGNQGYRATKLSGRWLLAAWVPAPDRKSDTDGDWVVVIADCGTGIRACWNTVTEYLKTNPALPRSPRSAAPALAADDDECPTCHAKTGERCHTRSGGPVKENHGRHLARDHRHTAAA